MYSQYRALHDVIVYISLVSIVAVAMATRMTMRAMEHFGSGRQYTQMMEHVTYLVAIDTGNRITTRCPTMT